MKKIFATMLLAAATTGVFAQAGEKAIGVGISYGTEVKNPAIGLKFQYNFTDPIRIDVGGDYFFKKNGVNVWDINANVHYLFNIGDGFKAYPLAGLTLLGASGDGIDTETELGGNIGAGLQYDLNSQWRLNLEAKYQIVDNWNQFVPSLTIAYKF